MTISWKTTRAALRHRAVGARMPEAPVFWSDFQARARMVRQAEPIARGIPGGAPFWIKYAVGLAATGLVVIGLLAWPAHPAVAANEVKSLDVMASHSGVIIMDDVAAKGTVVWIADLQPETGGAP